MEKNGKWCLGCQIPQEFNICVKCKREVQVIRGHCFILNNFLFDDTVAITSYGAGEDRNLYGYEGDRNNIKTTFEGLKFVVHYEENATAAQMKEIIQQWSQIDFSGTKCLVVFLLSHGSENGIIYGYDGERLRTSDIISEFRSCDGLSHKLFFIQACRGDLDPPAVKYVAAGGPSISKEEKFLDTFVYHSTAKGYKSLVSPSESIFVPKLCEVLKKCSAKYKLNDLIVIVNKMVSEAVFTYNNKQRAQSPEAAYTIRSDYSFGEYEGVKEDNDDNGVQLVECRLRCKNPCYILTNTACGTHTSQCENFKSDQVIVEKTFKELNFDVTLKYLDNIKEIFESVQLENFANKECFVCVILSCGGFSGTLPIIYGTDGIFYAIDTITKEVNGNISLINAPKLFFVVVQKCTKRSYLKPASGSGTTKKGAVVMKSQWTDIFVYYVMLEEDGNRCSSFISTLCHVLREYSQDGYHLGDVVFRVNQLLYPDEIPQACHTLTSNIYFKYVGAEHSCDNYDTVDSTVTIGKKDTETLQGVPGCQTNSLLTQNCVARTRPRHPPPSLASRIRENESDDSPLQSHANVDSSTDHEISDLSKPWRDAAQLLGEVAAKHHEIQTTTLVITSSITFLAGVVVASLFLNR